MQKKISLYGRLIEYLIIIKLTLSVALKRKFWTILQVGEI